MAQGNPQRPKPDEFEVIFVERGRLECESYFRAGRNTITRWLKEAGKTALIRKRKQFVKSRAALERGDPHTRPKKAKPKDPKRYPRDLVLMAARHLQRKQAGSWVVYEVGDGWWMVGTVKRTEAELMAKAKQKGWNEKVAREQIREFPLNLR